MKYRFRQLPATGGASADDAGSGPDLYAAQDVDLTAPPDAEILEALESVEVAEDIRQVLQEVLEHGVEDLAAPSLAEP